MSMDDNETLWWFIGLMLKLAALLPLFAFLGVIIWIAML